MDIKFRYQTGLDDNHEFFDARTLLNYLERFKEIVNDSKYGFFHLTSEHRYIKDCTKVFSTFKHKKTFVQVGIGGSSLGPQMLIDALKSNKTKFLFFDNIDSDYTYDQLAEITNPEEALFYIVSKSGGTAETIAQFCIIRNWLHQQGIKSERFHEFFVICTDPHQGDLRELASQDGLVALEVPSNIGGRYSVLSPVGLLPALFANIQIEELYHGANTLKGQLLKEDVDNNPLLQALAHLSLLYREHGINQTVIMPYSSKLKTLGHWFVQLWAESLGKQQSSSGVYVGLTPIPSYGATDQHSQMQLFMQGPKDKCLLLIDIEERTHDYALQSDLKLDSTKKLGKHSLNQLMEAEFIGTLRALQEAKRPYINFTLKNLNAQNLGALILFFESLTVLMGNYLGIDPFDQPGVEKGKIYAYEYLRQL